MESSRTSLKESKTEQDNSNVIHKESSEISPKFSKLCTRNILSAIGSRFFSGSQESTEVKKPETPPALEKPMKEEKIEVKSTKKPIIKSRSKPEEYQSIKNTLHMQRSDRDFRKFKTKYNTGVGNIMRNWMSLIYCILVLRMNLIKFIIEKFPDFDKKDVQLQNQILLESKTMYDMVRKAQNFSQERSLFLWTQLEKLIYSRMFLKNSLDLQQGKETSIRDWKAAAAKLAQVQAELEKAQTLHKSVQKNKNQIENANKEKLSRLECLTNAKNAELEQLIEQITECKKKEVQMRGRILLNMKSYKDLKLKREYLLNVEKEMNQLKVDQNAILKEYAGKIQTLKNQIEEKESQIKAEKEEKKKIKANLEGFGDFPEKKSLEALSES